MNGSNIFWLISFLQRESFSDRVDALNTIYPFMPVEPKKQPNYFGHIFFLTGGSIGIIFEREIYQNQTKKLIYKYLVNSRLISNCKEFSRQKWVDLIGCGDLVQLDIVHYQILAYLIEYQWSVFFLQFSINRFLLIHLNTIISNCWFREPYSSAKINTESLFGYFKFVIFNGIIGMRLKFNDSRKG